MANKYQSKKVLPADNNSTILVWMTNRGRAWVYKKAAHQLANALKAGVQREISLDTSWIDDPDEGQELLEETLSQVTHLYKSGVLIVVKDAKWWPDARIIRNTCDKFQVFAVDVAAEKVEKFAKERDAEGLIRYILNSVDVRS